MRQGLVVFCCLVGAVAHAADDVRIEIVNIGASVLMVSAPQRAAPSPELALRLQQRVDLDLQAVSIVDACALLAEISGVAFVLDPEVRNRADEFPVTLRVTDMRIDGVMRWIERTTDIHLTPTREAIWVSPELPSGEGRSMRLYDLGALTMDIPDFPGPQMALDGNGLQFEDGGFGGGMMGPMGIGGGGARGGSEEERLEALRELLERAVARD